MHNTTSESAMTEVALALAMGFFSLMILTLISMGVEADTSEQQDGQNARILDLVSSKGSNSPASQKTKTTDIILFFDGKRFRLSDMSIADPDKIVRQAKDKNQRIILAVDPTISFDAALAARERLPVENLVVSSYSKEWSQTLTGGGNNAQN